MKKLFVLCCVLMLSGCIYQDVERYWIDAATKYCANAGGIYEITSWAAGGHSGYCANGKEFNSTLLNSELNDG